MKLPLSLLLMLALVAAPTFAKTLFTFGSAWKYFDADQDLGTDWTGVDYDDSAWNTDDAEFGFGDRDETTVLSGNTMQFYFRRAVTITEAEGYLNAVVQVIRDDGCVVYVNGQEVGRDNMPDGPVPHKTAAVEALAGTQETTPVPIGIPDGLLTIGTNIIAVSLHNQKPSSSDMSFDAQLDADIAPSPSPPPPTSFESEVFPRNSVWSYLDTGADVSGAPWSTVGYNAGSWKSGPGKLGYSDEPATEVARNGVTVYFRHSFQVAQAARVETGSLSVLRDDGCVCYVNGNEVFRSNMPAGDIDATTLAVTGVSHGDETVYSNWFSFDGSVFVDGENIIGCSVHQQSEGSSDLAFDAEMKVGLLIDFSPAPVPSPSSSSAPAASPSSAPSASPSAGADPSATRSPTPTVSPSPGSEPSMSSSATTSPAPSSAASPSSTSSPAVAGVSPSPSPSTGADGNRPCECSCTCLASCPAGDPLLTACDTKDSGSSNSGVIVGVVVGVIFVAGLAAAGLFFMHNQKKKKEEAAKKDAKNPTANPMLLTNGEPDLEAGDASSAPRKSRSSKDKDRSSSRRERSSRDKDGKERSSSRRHRVGEKDGDRKRSSSRRHRDGEKEGDDKKRSSRTDKERSSRADKERSSSSRRDRDGKERSSSRRPKDGEKRSSSRRPHDDKDRSPRRHRDDKERSHRSRSPRKAAN